MITLLRSIRADASAYQWHRAIDEVLKSAEGTIPAHEEDIRGLLAAYDQAKSELHAITDLVGNRPEAGTYAQVEGYVRACEEEIRRAFTAGFNAGVESIDKFGEQHDTAEEAFADYVKRASTCYGRR